MQSIVCNTTFLDGRDRFEQGETRIVEDERAARFIAAGWASTPGEAPAPGETGSVTLAVQNVTQKTEVQYG